MNGVNNDWLSVEAEAQQSCHQKKNWSKTLCLCAYLSVSKGGTNHNRGHFWSRDKDGGHTIRSAMAGITLMQHANFTDLCFRQNRSYSLLKCLHCGNRNFRVFLLLWPWPWSDDLHIRTWLVTSKDVSQRKWALLSKETDIHRPTYRNRKWTRNVINEASRL